MDEDVVKIAITVTVTPDCKKMIKASAKKNGLSQGALIERAVREIVDRWAHEAVVLS